ncbi:MAG: recombinase family protein [Deltaproteobacteria bacterium]|nr:recombinase family protein [Deltaproteobacteria bacterium]
MQRSELLSYCNARGFNDVEIYEDIGRTGTNDNRPALKKLIADAKQRKFDIVMCNGRVRSCSNKRTREGWAEQCKSKRQKAR